MLLEEPVVVTDERTTHAPALPEGILEQHLDQSQQKRIAVANLNTIKFLVSPNGTRAISTEEIKSPAHQEIIEQSLKTLLGERIDNTPYLREPESGLLGGDGKLGFVELNAPVHIKMLADAGVKDFAKVLEYPHDRTESPQISHAARVRANTAHETEIVPAL